MLVYRLPYIEATILELLRYKTIAPLTVHSALKNTEVGGYFVPVGTTVSLRVQRLIQQAFI